MDGETEARGGYLICPKSHSYSVEESSQSGLITTVYGH